MAYSEITAVKYTAPAMSYFSAINVWEKETSLKFKETTEQNAQERETFRGRDKNGPLF